MCSGVRLCSTNWAPLSQIITVCSAFTAKTVVVNLITSLDIRETIILRQFYCRLQPSASLRGLFLCKPETSYISQPLQPSSNSIVIAAITLEASSLHKTQHSSLAPGDYPALAQYLMKISYSASALHTAGLDLEIVSF